MRITFVMPGGAGGGARVIARFATGLVERGHDVHLLHPSARGNLKDALRAVYLNLRYRHRRNWLRTFPGVVQPYATLTPELVGCNDLLIGVGVDCVLAIAELPRQCGIKVNNCHGREPWIMDRMLRAWRVPMPRIVVASHLVQEMRDRGSEDDIFVVHNGMDRSEYFPSSGSEQRDGVGAVYHGGAVKDPAAILAVFRIIHERRPRTPLYVFGTFPRPRGLPRAAKYIRFPSLPIARDLYSRSQVWFCASRSEGFPAPPLEAMACGCAVVSTDCGGTDEQIDDGANGFLVPVGDAELLADRILQLLGDSALRKKFVLASQATLDRFSWPQAVDSFESALESILGSGTPNGKRKIPCSTKHGAAPQR